MCLILDTNKYGDFLTPTNRDMEPVRKWMQTGNGKIAYSPTEKMQSELNRHNKMREQFDRYRETDKLKLVPSDKVRRVIDGLRDLQSDDPDIIALAQVAGIRLLVSGDTNLHADFKQIIGGNIYQTKRHQHLLKRDLCP
jgi:hypothetical protein